MEIPELKEDYSKLSLRDKQQIFSYNTVLLYMRIFQLGCKFTYGEADRTKDQQYLYYKGLTIENGKLVQAPRRSWTMNSMHLDRLAIDLNIQTPNEKGEMVMDWGHTPYHYELGKFWESLHPKNKWAVTNPDGSKKDLGHFEMQRD